MTILAVVATEIAHQPARAAEPLPELESRFTRATPPTPQEVHGPGEPILSDNFDANGDGSNDAVVIAPSSDPSGVGRVVIVSTATDEVLWQFSAEQTGDVIPIAATAGDVNDDGLDDVIITIMRWNETTEMMDSWVDVRSGVDGALLFNLQSPAVITDGFGVSVAAAGDVDGDGHDDIIVGAPLGGKQVTGRAYVFSGLDGALLRTVHNFGPGAMLGASVAGLGDIDGDGNADYIVGAPADEQSLGFARAYSGATGALLRSFTATEPGGEFGRNVAALGDITGDGVAEVVVTEPAIVLDADASGAPLRQGRVHVYSGADGLSLATLEGDTGYTFGATLRSMGGDGDQDGFGDLLVSAATLQDPMNLDAATLTLYSGPTLPIVFTSTYGDLVSGAPLTQPPTGDLNGDGVVGDHDLSLLLGAIGAGDESNPANDLNHDGSVDVGDLAILIEHFGQGPSSPVWGWNGCQTLLGGWGEAWVLGLAVCGVWTVATGGVGFVLCGLWWTENWGLYGGAATGLACGVCIASNLIVPNACP